MKAKLLLFITVCCMKKANGQCQGPPPPAGYINTYALDTDNDGFALFDMDYYITYIERPRLENIYGVSSLGYDFTFRTGFLGTILPLQYTNVTANYELRAIVVTYTGSGPTFDPQPPCYWPPLISTELQLIVVPYDGDFDGDGIPNIDEDTNDNLNLMDDDDDSDGIINLKDSINNLSLEETTKVTLTLYPNPVTNGSITFESSVSVSAVSIYDLSGKQVARPTVQSNSLRIDTLANGIYFIQFKTEHGSVFKKISIQ